MKSRAAVAFAAGKPLEIVEVDLEGPRAGEVLIEIKARSKLSFPSWRKCLCPSLQSPVAIPHWY